MAAALIVTADHFASEWIFHDDRQVSASEIKQFLLTRAQVSLNLRAYDFLIDFVMENQSKFRGDRDSDVYGMLEYDRIYILPSVFNRALQAEGFSVNGFISWMKSTNRLIAESGRLTSRKMINGNQTRCYAIMRQDVGEDSEDGGPFDL